AICTSATALDPELCIRAEPVPEPGIGTIGGVSSRLKSQFRRDPSKATVVGPPAPGLAPALPTAKIIVEAVNKVIAAADVPKCVSARIWPHHLCPMKLGP